MSKKISFIIPAYNAEQYIESCLSRILSVSYENYDVIVVDDGSTDNTASILALINDPKLKVIRQENSGVSSARNAGLNLTDADYVIFIDVDDIVLPEQLDKLFCKIQFDRDVYMYAYEHEENGKIRRIMRGVYENPKFNDFLGEYVKPHPDKIAKALARNYGWTIVPCGDTALNMLGLSTQVPAVWLYVSDGNYREYTCGNFVIQFKRTTNREISNISFKTALVIQAIKALGKDKITGDVIEKIRSLTTDEEKEQMFVEAKYATAWIYDVIKEICGGTK